MPAYFETGFSVREPMWHGLGNVLEDYPENWDDARRAADLLWEPTYADLFVQQGVPARCRRLRTTGGSMPRMTDHHKAALLEGREQGKLIRAYLAALHTPGRRGRKRTPESAARQLAAVDARLANGVDPLTRVQLLQQRLDLEASLEALTQATSTAPTLARLEEDFVRVAKRYSDRKGITYVAWREARVPTAVLRRAGIYPERARTNGHGR